MNILMFTNTYIPHTGGVAQSVDRFTASLQERGHQVLIIAPVFSDQPEDEIDVVRIPAIQNFNGSDFSLALPFATSLQEELTTFEPDIIHSHHPYLLGDSALRTAAQMGVPLVFTHHTFYEHYLHYVPLESHGWRRFVIELSTRYANLCDAVIAPSGSVRDILQDREVRTPITILPTGIDATRFSEGDGTRARAQYGIDEQTPVIGHVGRLALEKNLGFLTDAFLKALTKEPSLHLLIVGDGEYAQTMRERITNEDMEGRVTFTGVLSGRDLIDAYSAMNLFAFASQSETQGMVLVESMACGVPVVALDATGARDVIRDGLNGRLVETEETEAFVEAMLKSIGTPPPFPPAEVRDSITAWHMDECTQRLESLYQTCLEHPRYPEEEPLNEWETLQEQLAREWELWRNRVAAMGKALSSDTEDDSS